MIMPSDKEYQVTKQIMLGRQNIPFELQPLADWIDKKFDVKTINLYYDIIEDGRPRLGVYFENREEANSFYENGEFTNYDSVKQNQIAFKYKEVLAEQNLLEKNSFFDIFKSNNNKRYKSDNIWVYISAFEPIARIEANEGVPQDKVMQLKTKLNCIDLWEISRCFSGTTFFLYTDEQVKQYENSETRKIWADKYFDLLEPYNEFGYFKRDKFNIYLDSKENFDNNYESNWYYYYK
jgi:hypothetical protein